MSTKSKEKVHTCVHHSDLPEYIDMTHSQLL